MAGRPERNNVDYFPFLCKEGKAMYYIEQTYGNDGYAVWVKILRLLAVTNFHYLNLSEPTETMFLASKCRVPSETLEKIIEDLCKLGEFNADLWDEYRVVFSEKFTENIQEAYKRRSNKCMQLSDLRTLLLNLSNINRIKGSKDTHSRVDKSIVEVTKVTMSPLKKRASAYVEFVNQTFSRKYQLTAKVQAAFNARIGTNQYTPETLRDVVVNVKNSEFHIGNNFGYATPEYLLRESTIEKFKHSPVVSKIVSEPIINTDQTNQRDFAKSFE